MQIELSVELLGINPLESLNVLFALQRPHVIVSLNAAVGRPIVLLTVVCVVGFQVFVNGPKNFQNPCCSSLPLSSSSLWKALFHQKGTKPALRTRSTARGRQSRSAFLVDRKE